MTRAVLVYAKKPGLRIPGVAKGHGADRIQEMDPVGPAISNR